MLHQVNIPHRLLVAFAAAFILMGCGSAETSSAPTSIAQQGLGRTRHQETSYNSLNAMVSFDATTTKDVYIAKYSSTTDALLAVVHLDTVFGCEGVQLGTNSAGQVYCIVSTIDEAATTSHLVMFTDVTGDSLPDQSTRATITTLPGSLLGRCALDVTSGALYVIDSVQSRILRFTDQNGDLVPDGTAQPEFFAMSTLGDLEFSPRSLGDAGPNAVVVIGKEMVTDPLGRSREVHLNDGDGDGDAEEYVEGEVAEPQVVFVGLAIEGEGQVEVYSDVTGDFQVRAVSDSAVLGTFGSTDGALTVTLSRNFLGDEEVEIFDVTTSTVLASDVVRASTEPLVLGPDRSGGEMKDGATVEVRGKWLTGTEVVDIQALDISGSTWQTCSVTGSTTETLTVMLPSLSLTSPARFSFRVSKSNGTVLYQKFHLIKNDPG